MSGAGGGDRRVRLPGDLAGHDLIDRMVRVDHAGEYGAVRIYEGQLAVLGRSPAANVIGEMAAQERAHLARFEKLVAERRVRPSLLLPLWHVFAFALGAGTALLGEKAAMACTAAVEEVIDEHYAHQIADLDDDEAELKTAFTRFREDELGHRDTALDHGAKAAPGNPVLGAAIKAGSRLAIWLSERL